MLRYVVGRLLWMVPTLFGITLLTFVVLDVLPMDRAALAVDRTMQSADATKRAEAIRRLKVRWGMIDRASGEPVPTWDRYCVWLERAARFDFGDENESPAAFRERFLGALVTTVLIGAASICVALAGGIALGVWTGLRPGTFGDRCVSTLVLIGFAVPEFVKATLLLLLLGGGLFDAVLPAHGLRDPASSSWSWGARFLDLCAHLVMPVLTLSVVPGAAVMRHVREAIVRAGASDFVAALRGWGMPERTVRRSMMRHGMLPVATLIGTMLPIVVAGSVVVEQIFALPGIGRLALQGVAERQVGVVMAVTLLVSVVTLGALLLSDLAHRRLDARVKLR